jgi:hypothetical protein
MEDELSREVATFAVRVTQAFRARRVLRGLAAALFACALVFGPAVGSAHAMPVEWTVFGEMPGSGAGIVGTLMYDADLDSYSAISLTTLSGATFQNTYDDVFTGSSTQLIAKLSGDVPGDGDPVLVLDFLAPLTNVGGIVMVDGFEGTCVGAGCSLIDVYRPVCDFGHAEAVLPVPEPGLASLLGLGLVGLGFARTRLLSR